MMLKYNVQHLNFFLILQQLQLPKNENITRQIKQRFSNVSEPPEYKQITTRWPRTFKMLRADIDEAIDGKIVLIFTESIYVFRVGNDLYGSLLQMNDEEKEIWYSGIINKVQKKSDIPGFELSRHSYERPLYLKV
jgi:hypothetical protein